MSVDRASVLEELRKLFSCSLCSRLFQDPLQFPGCGHAFCRICIYEKLAGKGTRASECPDCHMPAWKKDLVENHKYGNIAGILQRWPREGRPCSEGQQLLSLGSQEQAVKAQQDTRPPNEDKKTSQRRSESPPAGKPGIDLTLIDGPTETPSGLLAEDQAPLEIGPNHQQASPAHPPQDGSWMRSFAAEVQLAGRQSNAMGESNYTSSVQDSEGDPEYRSKIPDTPTQSQAASQPSADDRGINVASGTANGLGALGMVAVHPESHKKGIEARGNKDSPRANHLWQDDTIAGPKAAVQQLSEQAQFASESTPKAASQKAAALVWELHALMAGMEQCDALLASRNALGPAAGSKSPPASSSAAGAGSQNGGNQLPGMSLPASRLPLGSEWSIDDIDAEMRHHGFRLAYPSKA